MNRDLSIVTGANRGIGKAIALKLAKQNHDVMLFGRDLEALKKTEAEVKELNVDAEIFAGDAADENFVKKSVDEIIKKYGKIDHLINNAGTSVFKKVVDAELADFKKQMDPNVFGVFNFTHQVLPNMIENKKGSIITIASLAGKNSFVSGAMYSATKHAVLGFSKSLMLEVREYGIRVAAICPGSVNTEFFNGSGMRPNKDKILQPDDVAETVWSIISMPQNALISEVDIRPTNPK